jgi:hypothetical protein
VIGRFILRFAARKYKKIWPSLRASDSAHAAVCR